MWQHKIESKRTAAAKRRGKLVNIKFIYCLLVIVDCAVGFSIAISHASCIFSSHSLSFVSVVFMSELRNITFWYFYYTDSDIMWYCACFTASKATLLSDFGPAISLLCSYKITSNILVVFIVCSQLCGENFCGILSESFAGGSLSPP